MLQPVFNIRVYGILINEKKEVLVTDEYRFDRCITKFPGGGLHFGEGTLECLMREMREETGCETEIISHYYTTDFFQHSAFNPSQQVIGIYYLIRALQPLTITVKEKQFDFDLKTEGAQLFRWIPLLNLKINEFTFPIDQKVASMLTAKLKR